MAGKKKAVRKMAEAKSDLYRGKISRKDYREAAGFGGDRPKRATRMVTGGKVAQ